MKRVIYPGSFDPITKGHMNIIEQASDLFDEVIVAIMQNPSKKTMFTIEERTEMIEKIYKDKKNIIVLSGTGATIDIAIQNNCKAIIRGLRGLSDYDYEVSLQQINKEISNNKVNTICLFADKDYQFISSSMVKELLLLDKDISKYVDPIVSKLLLKRRLKC